MTIKQYESHLNKIVKFIELHFGSNYIAWQNKVMNEKSNVIWKLNGKNVVKIYRFIKYVLKCDAS